MHLYPAVAPAQAGCHDKSGKSGYDDYSICEVAAMFALIAFGPNQCWAVGTTDCYGQVFGMTGADLMTDLSHPGPPSSWEHHPGRFGGTTGGLRPDYDTTRRVSNAKKADTTRPDYDTTRAEAKAKKAKAKAVVRACSR